MSKIGIVRDGAISVNKPVKLEFINKVETSPTLIKLTYNVGVPSSINIDSNIVILLANPEPLTYTGELIRKIVLRTFDNYWQILRLQILVICLGCYLTLSMIGVEDM